jgi:hypothetical protein
MRHLGFRVVKILVMCIIRILGYNFAILGI